MTDVAARANDDVRGGRTAWTFLSNHARVLASLDEDPSIRLRDVAHRVGITERAAQSIVADLASDGFVTRTRVGRRNQYEVHRQSPLGEGDGEPRIGELLDLLNGGESPLRHFRPDALHGTPEDHRN